MLGSISLDQAELAAIFVESILVGILTVLYCVTLWILYHKHTSSRTRSFTSMSIVASTMYLLSIAHLSVAFYRVLQGFTNAPSGVIDYYLDLSAPTNVAKSALAVVQTTIGDWFGIYRVYIIWEGKYYVIILPVMVAIANMAMASIVTYKMVLAGSKSLVFVNQLQKVVAVSYSMTLVITIVSTALIAARLWYYRATLGPSMKPYLSPVMEVIIQSAVIYAAGVIVALTTYLANSNVQNIIVDANQPLIGIVFMLVIVRIGLDTPRPSLTTRERSTLYEESRSQEPSTFTSLFSYNPGRHVNLGDRRLTDVNDPTMSSVDNHCPSVK